MVLRIDVATKAQARALTISVWVLMIFFVLLTGIWPVPSFFWACVLFFLPFFRLLFSVHLLHPPTCQPAVFLCLWLCIMPLLSLRDQGTGARRQVQ